MSGNGGPTLRSVALADLAAIHALNRRVEMHDRLPLITPLEEFEEWRDDPHLDLARDTRIAEVGDEPAGWARIWHRPSGAREERAFLMGAVDPRHRGRRIGSALLAWQIERAIEILNAADPTLPRFVRAQAYDFDEPTLRLYRRHGLVPVRYVDELLRDLEALPVVDPPADIAIVPWDVARSEAARMAQNDAFADHWGSTPLDAAAWEHLLGTHGTRLEWSFLALDGDRVVGLSRNAFFPDDEALHGRREGWIFQVGVAKSHRKRGIASALIGASLAAFRAAGLTHSALGVDSANPTGAYALYERLGYRPVRRSVVHQIALP